MSHISAPRQVVYELTFAIREEADVETGLHESRCVELGTASNGISIEDALKNIREACDLELSVFDTSTQLVDYLRRHGVQVWTDGDAYREMDRLGVTTKQLEYGVLSMPERFTREMACA